MDSGRTDFLGQYKAISAKLKKRFLRKPNVSEASSNFGTLARELELQECPHYAAFCCLAVARCENTLGNAAEESQILVKAARLFLEAEQLDHQLLCPGFSENLNAALSCYTQAVDTYMEQNQAALAAALCLEIGKALEHLGRTAQAIPHYKRAAELQQNCALDYLNALELIADCTMKTGDYDGALNTLTEICAIAEEHGVTSSGRRIGVFASILGKAEITRVLLLLILQPTPQRLLPEHAKTLEKYAWDASEEESSEDNAVSYLNEDLFLLMQSLVMATQSHDDDALKALEKDLWPYLSAQQNDLLHQLTERIS